MYRKVVLVVGVLAAAMTACAAPDAGPTPQDQVDVGAWRAEFVARSVTSNDPDMNELYREAAQDCDSSVDDLAMKIAAPAVDPTLVAMNLKYVCPGQQQKVNEALSELQNSAAAFDAACGTPAEERTAKQQRMADAEGTCGAG